MRNKIIIISVVSVVIIALTIFLSIYFCISINVNEKIESFFAEEGDLGYYNTSTGEINIINSSIGDLILEKYKNVKYTNTIFIKNILGGGISLRKNNKKLFIYDKYVLIEDKWYKTNKEYDGSILDEIIKQINNN